MSTYKSLPFNRALLEAAKAAGELVGNELKAQFILVGGLAMILYGSTDKTSDADTGITAESLAAFENAAASHERFYKTGAGWEYECIGEGVDGIRVSYEFLDIHSNWFPKLHGCTVKGGISVMVLQDLAICKAMAYTERGEPKDLVDLGFVLKKMKEYGEKFRALDEENVEVLLEAADLAKRGNLKNLLKELGV